MVTSVICAAVSDASLLQSPPLECVTAGYFARVVGMLLFRRTADVMDFLQGRRHLLGRLVSASAQPSFGAASKTSDLVNAAFS